MTDKYYGIDIGGTNLRIGKVNPATGDLIEEPFVCDVSQIASNQELTPLIASHIDDGSKIGISTAGDVDEKSLIIKLSPNSRIQGEITFGRDLSDMGHEVSMTNDMRAAAQAAAQYDPAGKDFSNVLMATYSSGFNCAVVRDGENVTSAEISHIPYKKDGLFCGCGGRGHIETYVSGNGAALMAKEYFLINKTIEHPILKYALVDFNAKAEQNYEISDLSSTEVYAQIVYSIGAEHVYKALEDYPTGELQKSIRDTQVEAIADSFGIMNSAFNPIDVMIFMGSQTKDWDAIFKPAIRLYQEGGLQLPSLPTPDIVRTELPDVGIQGAVAYFLNQHN